MPSRPWEESSTSTAEKIKSVLATKGLTLYRVSQQSAALYGRSSPYFVPHNLYYDLRNEKFSPSAHQIFSLSRISGYRFRDWLRICGFDIENITRLQVQLPARRTIPLDTSLTDPNEWVGWFRNRALRGPISSIAPLVQLLAFTPQRRISSISQSEHQFLYAKIGLEDALAFPDLIPGSIVRINPQIRPDLSRPTNSGISDRLFLVEHSHGFCCCRLRILANDVIVPFDNLLSSDQVELHPREARIWGGVDFEFRPLLEVREPHLGIDLAHWKPQVLREGGTFGQLLKTSRRRLHTSTRQAASASQTIAWMLDDDRYVISSSSLCDYELHDTPPRDFHKIITLCAIYGLRLEAVMRAMRFDTAESGTESMPDRFVFRGQESAAAPKRIADTPAGFFESLLEDCENEVPFFLRDLVGTISGSAHLSIDDFFWVGDHDPLHPYLANGMIVVVNRRRKTPVHFVSKPIWQQPIYIVLKRDGTYLAACCGPEDGKLVVFPYGPDFHPRAEFRPHRDAEILGQIVAIARRFP